MYQYQDQKEMRRALNSKMIIMLVGIMLVVTAFTSSLSYGMRCLSMAGMADGGDKDILEALTHLMTFDEHLQVTLSYEEYLDLGLNGREDSAEKRAQIARSLHLGKPNAKTLFKRLNMLQLHKTDVEKLLGQPYE